jgi:hypothetical protein
MADIILYTQFDPELVNIEDVSKTGSGGVARIKFVNVSYGPDKRRIKIQFPSMRIPFSSSSFEGSAPTVNVTFDDTHDEFLQKLRRLDERLLEAGISRSEQFFGSFKAMEVVREKLNVSVREKQPYRPSLNAKCIMNPDGTIRTPVFDKHGTRLAFFDVIKKRAYVTILLSIPCVYISGSGFGFSRKVDRIRIDMPAPEDSNEFMFVDEVDDDNNKNAMAMEFLE